MLFGRKKEIEILKENYESNNSSFIAIYGRRIGKTYLVNETFNDDIFFKYTGIYN